MKRIVKICPIVYDAVQSEARRAGWTFPDTLRKMLCQQNIADLERKLIAHRLQLSAMYAQGPRRFPATDIAECILWDRLSLADRRELMYGLRGKS